MDVEALKATVCAEVDRLADQLLYASHEIHAHPELNFEEHFAHDLLVDQLRSAGLDTTAHAYGIDTAFEAAVGETGFNVAVLCEYDALPAIGHACGHNVIATAGLGAGLAAAAVAEQAGGMLRIMGTPAEEGGGGKIADGQARRIRRRRRGDDGAPGRRRPDRDGHHRVAGVARAVPRQGRPRRCRAVGRAQRARRRRARLHEHRGDAPAHPADRADPRHLHQGRRQGQHRAGGDRDGMVRAIGDDRVVATVEGARASPRSRVRRSACSCTIDHRVAWPHLRRHDRQRADGRRVRQQRGPGRPQRGRSRGRWAPRRRQHRHGQRQLPRAVDPPDDQGRRRRRGDPHAWNSPSGRGPPTATRPCSTAPRRWR